MANTYQYGDKEYTRQQVIDYGRAHYPKLYWIPRGIGISAIASAVLLFVLIGVGALLFFRDYGKQGLDAYWSDVRIVAYFVSAFVLLLIGLVLFATSYAKPNDDKCFIHGEKCLRQIAYDRAAFRNSHKED